MAPVSAEDKRRHCRYAVPRESLLVVSQETPRVWVVADISRGGLSFEYTPPLELRPDVALELFWYLDPEQDRRLRFGGIPFRRIYDIGLCASARADGIAEIRRCGLEFRQPGLLVPGKLALALEKIRQRLPLLPR